MTKLNMANMNTLLKKVYLLAGVVLAANIFVVNEMKASDNKNDTSIHDNTEQEEGKKRKKRDKNASSLESVLNFVLSRENTINLIGGVVLSGINNYLKWWDYNPGMYCKSVWFGWRSKKLFDIVQVDINLNLGRGISWVILGTYNFIKGLKNTKYFEPLHFSYLVVCLFEKFFPIITLIGVFLIQGFVSAPLTFHISNFSISISLDSMLWAGIGKFLDKTEQQPNKGNQTDNNLGDIELQYINDNEKNDKEKKEEEKIEDKKEENDNNNKKYLTID